MKEIGILFTPDNIRAIREERKTQTRRILKGDALQTLALFTSEFVALPDNFFCPYGNIGDRLYIKEGIILHADGQTLAGYYMDGARVTNLGEKRLTAMFMAKKYARTWLEITDVRVQRLQDISVEDAIAEGITHSTMNDPRVEYQWLWDSINAKKHPWVNNDFVWALTFEVVPANERA